jgi:hypothetical protein
MSQSAVQKPSLKPQTESNAGVEASPNARVFTEHMLSIKNIMSAAMEIKQCPVSVLFYICEVILM